MTRLHAPTARELWHARVEDTPDAPFLLDDDGGAWTFQQADVEMRRMAAGLEAHGVVQGERVLVALPNSPQALFVHAALRELGAVLVPVVPGLTHDELAFQAAHCEARILIADEEAAALAEGPHGLPGRVETVIGGGRRAVATLEEAAGHAPLSQRALPGYDEQSPWVVFYTSGSTGRPKGVVLPAGSFVSAGMGYADRFEVGPDDNYILPTPMAHAVGGLTAQSIALRTGCRLTLVDRFSPSRFWGQVERAGATVTILFPAHLNLLLELEASGPARGETPLRQVITHQWIEPFRARFGIELGLCWGMTETGATSAGSPPGYDGSLGEGYVGPGMNGVEIGILSAEGARLPAGEVGEIALRHRHAMLEYLNDADATARVLTEGWVRSGDYGSLDERGHLFFRGRIKNMIKRSGENVSPEEVESALNRHELVAESLVLGIPDPLRTEEVAAVVVLRSGADLDAPALAAFAAQHLARWKSPRYLALQHTPLPRLANGKIDRSTIARALDLAACWDRERERAGAHR